METIAGETGWDGLAHSLVASGGTNLTSSLYSGDLASLNSSRSGGSYLWSVSENATTSPPHVVPEPRMRDLGLARAEIGVLGLVLALTTLGNGFILWVLLRRKKQNAPMHLFMVNLCVADLVVALFQVLPQLVWDITERFQGPDLLCRSIKYLQIVGMFASSYMIVAMTVDRHHAICCPLQAYRGGAVSRWNTPVMVAWGLALVLSIPQVFIFSRSEVSPGEFECWGHFADSWGLKAYVTWMTVAVFLLPALIITVCQVRIFREIHNNIYLKSERMVSAELKNNAVIFRFQGVKKDEDRVRERGRGGCGVGREGRGGHLLVSVDTPSGSHSNPISISPGVNPDCYDYVPHVSQHSGCHGARHAAPQAAFSSPDNLPPGPGPGEAKTPPCDGSHGPGKGCYCESFEIPSGSALPSLDLDYPAPLPLVPPPPSITKAMSKTVRMTLVIVLVYTVCWSPFFIVQLWAAWDPDPPEQGVAFTILMLLASLNSCTNPWIYTAFSSSVSRELQALLGCRPRTSRRGSLYDDSTTTTHTSTTGHKDSLY